METLQQTALSDNLKRLCIIRLIVLGSLSLALVTAWAYRVSLPYAALGGILLLLGLIDAASWLRIRQRWSVTEIEFFLHILADIIGLGLLFYFSGGATNPFVSYFLVPLSITAATLPWRYTWLVAALCIGIYSLLLIYYQPLSIFSLHAHSSTSFNPHFLGMWANFTLSALLITAFVVRMARALRAREQLLNQLREDDLRDEQIMAVATLAAGTAHELGTPLSTMKILLGEMRAEPSTGGELAADLEILEDQVDSCRSTLKKLVATADRKQSGCITQYLASTYFETLVGDWHLMHPETELQVSRDENLQYRLLRGDATLKQALINLLNNAFDASPEGIVITVHADETHITLEILDNGPGLPGDIAEQLGKPVIIASAKGLGIGLLLTHATLTKFGGSVTLYNRPEGGTRTVATLPADRV